MKKIFKKNQIIITVLALMIAGYINYADGVKKKNAAANKTKEVVGTDVDKDLKDVDIAEPGNTVFTSGSTSQFIVSAKLEREQMRASNKQTLLDIINNVNISEAEKTAASEKMVAITTSSEKEVAAELMLEAKGFNNVIVSILNDKVDVVVERESLTETEIAQIEDIVTRKTEIAPENIVITPMSSQTEDGTQENQ